MTEGSISRRYARALLLLAKEANLVDRFGDNLENFLGVARANDGQVLSVMSNPGFTEVERRELLDSLLRSFPLEGMVQNFLRLLLDKRRMAYLPDIARAYRELADLEANRLRATVVTASPISSVLQNEIKGALQNATGKTIVLEAQVDPALIGGLVARVGGRVIDASLRTRLEQLQLSLSQNLQA